MQGWIVYAALLAVLLSAAVADWRTHRIPNWLTYSAIVGGVVLTGILGPWDRQIVGPHDRVGCVGMSLLTMGLGLLPMWLIFIFGGVGGGDVKLMGACGAITARPECVLMAALYAFLAAVLLAVVIMVKDKIVMRTLRRILAAVLSSMAGVPPAIPEDSPRVPFAVAILVGGALAGWEHLLHRPLPWTDLLRF